MSRRSLLLAALLAAVGGIALISYFAVRESNGSATYGGTAPSDTYEITIGDCRPTLPHATLEGTLTNTTDEIQGYSLLVEFIWPDGRRDQGGNTVADVPPGETVDWIAVRNVSGPTPADIECELIVVDSWEYD